VIAIADRVADLAGRAGAYRRDRAAALGVGVVGDEVVPVFWGCGVTPQEAVRKAALDGTVIGHSPGYMLVLDIRDWDIIPRNSSE